MNCGDAEILTHTATTTSSDNYNYKSLWLRHGVCLNQLTSLLLRALIRESAILKEIGKSFQCSEMFAP